MTESNGNGVAKPKSALTLLLEDREAGKFKTNESDKKATTEAFKKSMGERAKLQKALDDFDAKSDKTAIEMVKCFGTQHIMIAGVRYVPTSRGARVYYKKMGEQQDVVEL